MKKLKKMQTDRIACKFSDSCDCTKTVYRDASCVKCKWYYWHDSGYGYCKAFPQHMLVGWCRDICSFFEKR